MGFVFCFLQNRLGLLLFIWRDSRAQVSRSTRGCLTGSLDSKDSDQ